MYGILCRYSGYKGRETLWDGVFDWLFYIPGCQQNPFSQRLLAVLCSADKFSFICLFFEMSLSAKSVKVCGVFCAQHALTLQQPSQLLLHALFSKMQSILCIGTL